MASLWFRAIFFVGFKIAQMTITNMFSKFSDIAAVLYCLLASKSSVDSGWEASLMLIQEFRLPPTGTSPLHWGFKFFCFESMSRPNGVEGRVPNS
jgi:hypothetical protein